MKKPMFVMTALLVVLCIIYNYTNVEAKGLQGNTMQVVDFEDDGDTEEPSGEIQSSQGSAESFVAGEGASSTTGIDSGLTSTLNSGDGNTASGVSASSSGAGNNADSGEGSGSSGGEVFNGQTGREAADELLKSSEPDILGEDYQFGDDILQTDETTETFFEHIYNKTWEAFTGIQKIFTVIILMCFIVSAVMTLISIFGKKEKVLWYAFAMLLCLIILLCVVYAPQIAAAFNRWFMTT